MSTKKIRQVIYLMPDMKDAIKERAKSLGLTVTGYVVELASCDIREKILPRFGKGK